MPFGDYDSLRIVIMAAGQGHRWHNYLNRPKQLLEIDGEAIINRTIRLLRERGISDIYVTVKQPGQYGDLGVKEYITNPNEVAIDRIWGARELAPCVFLFGDTYYGDKSMDVILSDTHEYRFFGKAAGDRVKGNREIYGVKANEFVIQKAGELRDMYVRKKMRLCLAGNLLIYCLGLPMNLKIREHVAISKQLQPMFTELNDETIDFDKPSDYVRWMKVTDREIRRAMHVAGETRRLAKSRPIHRRIVGHKPIKTYYALSRMNYDLLHHFLPKIPADIDLVIGIPRDGIMVAYLISIYRNIPMTDLTSFCAGIIYKSGIKHREETEIKNILMVDDICATGRAMRDAREQIKDHLGNYKLYCAALYYNVKRNTDFSIDFYGCELVGPRAYEWTIADAFYLPSTMMDVDGILTPDWNGGVDSGQDYEQWLATAPLKIRPKDIGTLITWRREEHRAVTEEWLRRNKIVYSELIMADRSKWKNPSEFKAFFYKKSDARLLIESNPIQAEAVYKLTHRPVVCSENNEAFGVNESQN